MPPVLYTTSVPPCAKLNPGPHLPRRTLFASHLQRMAASIEIVPFSHAIHMYEDPDRCSAYSLSGHINISLSSPYALPLFERKRAIRMLLRSLVITFEGQTEIATHETGYSAFRIYSKSTELVNDDSFELSNDDHESSGPCLWSVVFNLTLPGWLPATSEFSSDGCGTRYALHASATIYEPEIGTSRSWLSTLCLPFQTPSRISKARPVHINIVRLTIPPPTRSRLPSLFPETHFEVSAHAGQLSSQSRFPEDVISRIRVQMSVPEYVDVQEESVPFTLRLRTSGLSEESCKRLRVTDFTVDVEQTERYRPSPAGAFVSRYPVPPREQQPPRKPLLFPHPLHSLYNFGGNTQQPPKGVLSRTFSILPEDASGFYRIAGDGYVFVEDAKDDGGTWFTLMTSVPIASKRDLIDSRTSWKDRRTVRSGCCSPLFLVNHRFYVNLTCSYDLMEGPKPETVTEILRFHVPLHFVVTPPDALESTRTPSPESVRSMRSGSSDEPLLSPTSLHTSTLPAYSQLFHANGDRKIDYSVPLPLYSPKPDPEDAPDYRMTS